LNIEANARNSPAAALGSNMLREMCPNDGRVRRQVSITRAVISSVQKNDHTKNRMRGAAEQACGMLQALNEVMNPAGSAKPAGQAVAQGLSR